MKDLDEKRANERYVVGQMIRIYCKKNHKTKKGLCPECEDLYQYASTRIEKCPFMETKTFCSNCRVHCYKPEYKEKIRKVMRFSGPRMLFVHPILAIKHVILTLKEKKKLEKEEAEKEARRQAAREKAEALKMEREAKAGEEAAKKVANPESAEAPVTEAPVTEAPVTEAPENKN